MLEGDDQATIKIRASAIEALADVRASRAQQLEIRIGLGDTTDLQLRELRETLRHHPGDVPTQLTLTQAGKYSVRLELPTHLKIHPSDELLGRLESIFAGKRVAHLR